MKYEERERALFARRAAFERRSPDEGPPPFAAVMAAIEQDQKAMQPKRAIRRASRVATAALAIAACVAAVFATARTLSPASERIVADRSDASAPIDHGVVGVEPEGPPACMLDRTLVESRNDTCTESRNDTCTASPAPCATYASNVSLEPSTCSIAGP